MRRGLDKVYKQATAFPCLFTGSVRQGMDLHPKPQAGSKTRCFSLCDEQIRNISNSRMPRSTHTTQHASDLPCCLKLHSLLGLSSLGHKWALICFHHTFGVPLVSPAHAEFSALAACVRLADLLSRGRTPVTSSVPSVRMKWWLGVFERPSPRGCFRQPVWIVGAKYWVKSSHQCH